MTSSFRDRLNQLSKRILSTWEATKPKAKIVHLKFNLRGQWEKLQKQSRFHTLRVAVVMKKRKRLVIRKKRKMKEVNQMESETIRELYMMSLNQMEKKKMMTKIAKMRVLNGMNSAINARRKETWFAVKTALM